MINFGSSPIELMAADAMMRGEIYCQGFAYTASWIAGTATALGANATVDAGIQITADSDFVVQEINLVSLTAAATFLPVPDYLLTVTVAGSGRMMMNQPVHAANFCGAYQNDRVGGGLPFPQLLPANTTVTNTLQNRTAVASNFAQLALIGFKVFYTGGNRRDIFHTA